MQRTLLLAVALWGLAAPGWTASPQYVIHISADGLRESLVGGVTEDLETLRLWRRLIRQARRGMHKGASARHPATGETRPALSHLHTQGAHDLALSGTRMLAIAGGTEYLFDDCATASPRGPTPAT